MNVFALCGISLVAYAAIQILGKENARIGSAVGICGVICLLLPAILSLGGFSQRLKEYLNEYSFIGTELLFRGLGIGLCCEITSDILRDAGSAQIANALDTACRISILLLCIPLWKELFGLVGGLLS